MKGDKHQKSIHEYQELDGSPVPTLLYLFGTIPAGLVGYFATGNIIAAIMTATLWLIFFLGWVFPWFL